MALLSFNWASLVIPAIALFFIARAFNKLAAKHGKNRISYTFMGIALFSGLVIAGDSISYVLTIHVFQGGILSVIFGLMILPVSVLICWICYITLKERWTSEEIRNRYK